MWRIAAPMILSNVSAPLLGMVDTGVMGHLESSVYLGAVAIGATIFTFLYIGMNFLRMGTTGIAAQSFGAGDHDGLRVSLGQALIVSLAIALTILLLQAPIRDVALWLLGGDAETQAHASTYFAIRVWSAPGTLANYVMIGWFLGLQNARVPLLIFLTINITNSLLDLLFVIGLGMKIEGVALGLRQPLHSHDGADVHAVVRHRAGGPARAFDPGSERRADELPEPDVARSRRLRACGRSHGRQGGRREGRRGAAADREPDAQVVTAVRRRVSPGVCARRR
ncbi:MAG: MATE family efflux transporter, partial [Pseudolabrys sp.]